MVKTVPEQLDGNEFLDIRTAARLLGGISTRTLGQKIREGKIPAYRVPGTDRLVLHRKELIELTLANPASATRSRRGPKPRLQRKEDS